MGWIESKSVLLFLPTFTDELVDGKASESLEPLGEVVGGNEVEEVRLELMVAVVVVTLNGSFLDGSVHALDLAVGPGMMGFGQAMFDTAAKTDPVEGMTAPAGGGALAVFGQFGELDAVAPHEGSRVL